MENGNKDNLNLKIMSWQLGILTVIVGIGIVKNLGYWILIVIAVAAGLYFYYSRLRCRNLSCETMERKIRKRFDERGFKNWVQDNVLFVTRNDQTFHLHLRDMQNMRMKRLYFVYDFGIEGMDEVSDEGWAVGANCLNARNRRVAFVSYTDSFSCSYATAISNPKDVIAEFDAAYSLIGAVIDDFNNLCPQLKRDYPNEARGNHGIGFVQSNEPFVAEKDEIN